LSEPKGKMTHPDPEALAEFRAGHVTGRRGARISAHLAGCEHCGGLCDQLAEMSALLAAVPAPAMPDAVARRLEGVLAAEAVKTDDSERAVDPRSRDRTASPRRPRRHWDFRLVTLRVLAPAAAVVVLAAGGYGLSRIGSSSTSSEAAGSGSTASAAAPPAAAVPSSAPTRAGAGPAIEAPARFGVVISETNYLPATLQQQLEHELQLHHAVGTARQLASGPVKECVLRVAGPATLALVEKARYRGQPAIVIVAARSPRDTAWVAASGCSASDRILATTTLPGTSTP
jgi:hypothetical protein